MKKVTSVFVCSILFCVQEGTAYTCQEPYLKSSCDNNLTDKSQRLTVKLLALSGLELALGIRESNRGDNFVAYGVELTYKLANNITFEADYITVTDISNIEPTASLRGGYTFILHGSKMSKVGFRGFVVPSFGYRYAHRVMYEYDGYSAVLRTHNLQAQVGYELEFGDLLKGGVLRFSVGGDYALSSEEVPTIIRFSGEHYKYNVFGRISIGMSFGVDKVIW